jgi:hypothetical protein
VVFGDLQALEAVLWRDALSEIDESYRNKWS